MQTRPNAVDRALSFSKDRSDLIFLLLCGALFVFQLATLVLSPLPLSHDEAYYVEWSKRLDWSYYSKGPVVAYFIAWSTSLLGVSEFAVRLPALVCSTLFSFVMYGVVRALFSAQVALMVWIVARSILIIASTAFIMTADSPTLLFWLVGVAAGYVAIRNNAPGYWALACFAAGLAVLGKYTAALLYLSFGLFLLITPSYRRHLVSKGFLGGTLLFLLCLAPMLLWDSRHGWVNFAHNASHLMTEKGVRLRPQYLGELVAGQLGLVGPILLPLLISVLFRVVRNWRSFSPETRFLAATSLPLFGVCVVLSLTKNVYANWPLPAYVGLLLLLATALQNREVLLGAVSSRWLSRAVALNIACVFVAHLPLYGLTLGLPAKMLPTKKMIGWDLLGEGIARDVALRTTAEGESPFVLTDGYTSAAGIAVYGNLFGEVFCANTDNRRMNQYDVWGGWERLKGRNAVIVLSREDQARALAKHFERISPMPHHPTIEVRYGDTLLKSYLVYVGEGFDGVPPEPPTRR